MSHRFFGNYQNMCKRAGGLRNKGKRAEAAGRRRERYSPTRPPLLSPVSCPFLCKSHHPPSVVCLCVSPPCFLMDIKESSPSLASRKRKPETSAKGTCKHVKPGPPTWAPDSLPLNDPLTWLSKVLPKPEPFFFQSSRVPFRFMYMRKGQWKDYASDISAAFSLRFAAHKETAKFLLSGQMYVVDFAHMMQLNLQTGFVHSVAWIDCEGKCFKPVLQFEGGVGHFILVVWQASLRPVRAMGIESRETSSSDFSLLGDRLSTLVHDDQEYLSIKEKFMSTMGSLAKQTSFVGIHRCTFEGPSAQVRLETFHRQEQAVAAARGNANVRYAWHGTSKKGVLGIVSYGFGQPGVPKHGVKYGFGVYLAPEGKPFLSAVYSEVDEDGIQHMLLCKVILGEMEQVSEGSKQFFPSSADYDTGVDDLASPARYIVWSTHMSTHVLPLFVVSFKMAPSLRHFTRFRRRSVDECRLGCLCLQPSSSLQDRGQGCDVKKSYDLVPEVSKDGIVDKILGIGVQKAPQSPWISFPGLFLRLGQKLSPFSLMMLQQLHSEFQIGRLTRKSLVRLIRAIAGDANLWQCVMAKQ
ncbi:hypothetical protein L7F22_035524 [Adiantum nelumboides]|nr:hypothetical protein [Adiantum nelumboides]